MKKIQFTIEIKASKEKIWSALWQDANYKKWASVFSEGAYAVTDWKEGSKALFLSSSGEGMYSTIAKNIPNEYMSFKHLGVVKDNKEQPIDEETRNWSGALENYSLKANGGTTELIVEMDVSESHEDYFKKTFPIALEKVKELAEK